VLLTAAGVVVGASVILTDPIFQGLGLSLIAGGVASTFLSWPAVPVLYYMLNARKEREQQLSITTQQEEVFHDG